MASCDAVTQSLSQPPGGGKGQFKEPVCPREAGASPHPLREGSREAQGTENVAAVSEGTSGRSPALAARALRYTLCPQGSRVLGDGKAWPSPMLTSLGLAALGRPMAGSATALKPLLAPSLLTLGSCVPGRSRLNLILSSDPSKRLQGFGSSIVLVCRNRVPQAGGLSDRGLSAPSPEVWVSEIEVP